MNDEETFVTGDKVEVITPAYSGVTARVVAVTPRAFGRMYSVNIIDGKGLIADGTRDVFGANALRRIPAVSATVVDNPRVSLEGKVIKPSEVREGDEIVVTHRVRDLIRANTGVVKNIREGWAGNVSQIQTASDGDLYRETYLAPEIKLIKAAEDALTVKLRNSPVRTVFLAGDNSHGVKISSDRWKVDNSVERRLLTTHNLRLSLRDKKVVFLKEDTTLHG